MVVVVYFLDLEARVDCRGAFGACQCCYGMLLGRKEAGDNVLANVTGSLCARTVSVEAHSMFN